MRHIILATALLSALAAPALSSAFWHGEVVGVANWDVLNIRQWPASSSRIIDSYDNGDDVSLTGRCKTISTNASFRVDGGQAATWKYNRMKKPNVWCQVSAPNGQIGWVRGSFVWPD
jgi:hypothetical protein